MKQRRLIRKRESNCPTRNDKGVCCIKRISRRSGDHLRSTALSVSAPPEHRYTRRTTCPLRLARFPLLLLLLLVADLPTLVGGKSSLFVSLLMPTSLPIYRPTATHFHFPQPALPFFTSDFILIAASAMGGLTQKAQYSVLIALLLCFFRLFVFFYH